jgi:hypothetical protein
MHILYQSPLKEAYMAESQKCIEDERFQVHSEPVSFLFIPDSNPVHLFQKIKGKIDRAIGNQED